MSSIYTETRGSEGNINESDMNESNLTENLAVPTSQVLKKKTSLRQEKDFKDQLMQLLKDPNYLAIMFGSSTIISTATVFPTIME